MPAPRPRARLLTAALLGALVALPVGLPAPASADEPRSRYLVQFTASADAADEARRLGRRGGAVQRVLRGVYPGAVVDLTAAQARALARSGRVRTVEADQTYRTVGTTTSPVWGLDRVDQRALPLSGSFTTGVTGKGVTAYVVDTGVLSSHREFAGRTAPGYTSVADGRGTEDCNGHGTHVAGTLAGTTYGVAAGATVVPVRVLGCDGLGGTSRIVAGLDWIVGHHAAGTPAVANLSLGGKPSAALEAAVDRLVADGVSVVVAAGNEGVDACTTSPARVPRVLTVGATSARDARASWSNSGRCLDLFAPGVSITSAWHTGPTATAGVSGTSMAAPHVAGAVAALLESAPGSSPADVAARLTAAATTGVVTSAGSGSPDRLLHADPALVPAGSDPSSTPAPAPAPAPEAAPVPPPADQAPAPAPVVVSAPSAPERPTAAAKRRSALVRWTQGSDGGAPLTAQRLSVYAVSRSGSAVLVGGAAVQPETTSVTVSGLRSGTTYAFAVSATNAAGTSPASALSGRVTVR